ncbi:MAG TPA: formimidoylglutamate deiminase [Cyclobacteriaceae bacterium]|nr:formimidoylglutamate deiminase [Cyclobacteriaceae bacterium]
MAGLNNDSFRYFRFTGLYTNKGWLMPAYVAVDENGIIRSISSDSPDHAIAAETVQGYALPGFQNAHSHAFQYAMTGDAEMHPPGIEDDFWTWREAMYRCALSVNPSQAEAIAAMVYAEMLRNGYTHVAEFHYLHHDKTGKPYSNIAEMGEKMLSAAKTAGIRITLIPVFYQKAGFGQPPADRQRRFISAKTDEYLKLLDASIRSCGYYALANAGFSVHSLRAVDGDDVKRTYNEGPKHLPFHLHVSEQKKEVTDCLAYTGMRPMQWLLSSLPVNGNFHLVHSTHLDDTELKDLAASKANVVLCPSTEGNLGDGIFRMKEYVKAGGRWCIGTDSHIGLDPLEEFRMIDYRQRLLTNLRSTFEGEAAHYLFGTAQTQGRLAMGRNVPEYFSPGEPFDAIVYNARSPRLSTASEANLLSVLLYHGNSSMAMGTIVSGKWVVKNQKHIRFESIRGTFVKAMKEIT